MSIGRSSGKPDRKRNCYDIPLMLNTNSKKFRALIRENIRDTIREEIKKFFGQITFNSSEGSPLVILNNISEELTPREEEIMALLVKKYSDRKIAATLGLKIDTVKNHMKNIRRKLGVKSRWQARDTYLKQNPETEIEAGEK